jgi:hypothetical protein
VWDYPTMRETGSHLRLTTASPSEHHVTIPAHDPLRVAPSPHSARKHAKTNLLVGLQKQPITGTRTWSRDALYK